MRRITFWLLTTITIVVLLFSYHTSTGETTTPGVALERSAPAPTSSAGAASASGPDPQIGSDETDSQTTTDSTGSSLSDGTFTGSAVDTRWGPVQVQIVVADGTITDVTVPVYPVNNHRDVEINQQALPILIEETTSAQSAQIDMVSGATVTSQGYIQSLQEAIDQARQS